MIIFRCSASIFAFFCMVACSEEAVVNPVEEREITKAEKEIYESVAKGAQEESEPVSVPSYSASDFQAVEPVVSTPKAGQKYYEQLQRDLRQEEIDRRMREIEQRQELTEADAAARRAEEKAEEMRQPLPLNDIDPYEAPRN
ncbi:MAG: hypothetical protein WBA51_09490 [Erythrobacter sp.]